MARYALIINKDAARSDAVGRMLSGLCDDGFKSFVSNLDAKAASKCDCDLVNSAETTNLVRRLKSRMTPNDELFVALIGASGAENELFQVLADLPYLKRTIISDSPFPGPAARLFADDGKSVFIPGPDWSAVRGRTADKNSDGQVSTNEAFAWVYSSGVFWPSFELLSEGLREESLTYLLTAPDVDSLSRVGALMAYAKMARRDQAVALRALGSFGDLISDKNQDEYVRGVARELQDSFILNAMPEDMVMRRVENFLDSLNRDTKDEIIGRNLWMNLGLLPTNQERIEFLKKVEAKVEIIRTSMVLWKMRFVSLEFQKQIQPLVRSAVREMADCENKGYGALFARAYMDLFLAAFASRLVSQKEEGDFKDFMTLSCVRDNEIVMQHFWTISERLPPDFLAVILDPMLQNTSETLFGSAAVKYAEIAPSLPAAMVLRPIEVFRNFIGRNSISRREAGIAYAALVKRLDQEGLDREISALGDKYLEKPEEFVLAYEKFIEGLPEGLLRKKAGEIRTRIVAEADAVRRKRLCDLYLDLAGQIKDAEMQLELDIIPYLEPLMIEALLIMYSSRAESETTLEGKTQRIRRLAALAEKSPPNIREIVRKHCLDLQGTLPPAQRRRAANSCLPAESSK